jgi:hypothetical protein
MPFAKAQQEGQSFLDFFYCRTFFKKGLQSFLEEPIFIFKYKSLVKQALPI